MSDRAHLNRVRVKTSMGLYRRICAAIHKVYDCGDCKKLYINCKGWKDESIEAVKNLIIEEVIKGIKNV